MARLLPCTLAALMLSPLAPAAGSWQGVTGSGLRFQGQLSRITADRLFLENTGTDPSLQFGIPLSEIQWIQWTGAEEDPELLLQALDSAPTLLGLLAGDTTAKLESLLQDLAASGQWRRLIRWTTRLVELEPTTKNPEPFCILHAWSLLELGLQGECRSWIDRLTGKSDPLEMDPRLCWLAGRSALCDGKLEEATFWARLPMLRIPVTRGPVARDLQKLSQSIRERERLEK